MKKKVARPILLAVGGMRNDGKEAVDQLRKEVAAILKGEFDYVLIFRSWRQVYESFAGVVGRLSKNSSLERILQDVAWAYEWHGVRYQERRWLKDLKPVGICVDGYLMGFD